MLQRRLVEILERDDIYEAAYWANQLKIKHIPTSVSLLLENIQQGVDSFPPDEETMNDIVKNSQNTESSSIRNAEPTSWEETDWSNSPWPSETSILKDSGFYEFPLTHSDISFVNDRRGLSEFLGYLRSCTEVKTFNSINMIQTSQTIPIQIVLMRRKLIFLTICSLCTG